MEDKRKTTDRPDEIEVGPLPKNGDKLIEAVGNGSIAAILSENEVMYIFIFRNLYQCFIHPLDGPEGRHKAWTIDEKSDAVIKNLAELGDQLFEIKYKPDMDFMSVMVSAEKAIINFLDMMGTLPAQDHDFMEPLDS